MVDVINSVVSYDMSGTDTDKLWDKIKATRKKKSSLIELYMSKDINRDELSTARIKCDNEIAEQK